MSGDVVGAMSEETANRGFTFRCGDGKELRVSSQSAALIALKCEYFRGVFENETSEEAAAAAAASRIIEKPDWDSRTAKNLVELITKGRLEVPFPAESDPLDEAAEQVSLSILIRLNIPGVVNPVVPQEHARDAKNLISSPTSFLLDTDRDISEDSWTGLIDKGVLIAPGSGLIADIAVDRGGRRKIGAMRDLEQKFRRNNRVCGGRSNPKNCRTWHVHTSKPVPVAVEEIRQVFRVDPAYQSNQQTFGAGEYSLRIVFGGFQYAVSSDLILKAVKKDCGASGYVHKGSSLGYFLDGGNTFGACPTFFGSFSQLCKALDCCPDKGARCSLRIGAPSALTLRRILQASAMCSDNPGSVGVQIETNNYFMIKTAGDMKTILKFLSEEGGVDGRPGPLARVVCLGYPKGIF